MEEKFRYKSKHFKTVLIVYVLLCSFIFPALIFLLFALFNNVLSPFIVVILCFIGTCIVLGLFNSVPSKFTADKNSVEFRILFKKINIRYSNIKSIEVTREYEKPKIRDDVGHYNEIIKFICKDGEYCFENIMKIDFEQTAVNPESLAKQFEHGKFMRLKNYILRQTGVTY